LIDILSKVLGERADAELAKDIKKTVCGFPEISGAYDLVLHNYGPDAYNGSVHIEVPDTLSADSIDRLSREVMLEVYRKHNVILTAVGIYSVNTKDAETVAARERAAKITSAHAGVLQMHGFYINNIEKTLRFDIVVSFDAEDRRALYWNIYKEIQDAFPGYGLQIIMDTDFSESTD
ncbi:cation transporter, partial [bacterium]|nr:cation transporter [bacterium]